MRKRNAISPALRRASPLRKWWATSTFQNTTPPHFPNAPRGPKTGRDRFAAFVLSIGVSFISGCTHIITQSTPYYEKGPTQLDPPEGDIEAGTYAMVVGSEGSYVRVVTITGVNAWVWDRAVMSVWDHLQKQDEEKKQREAREKLKKAQAGSQPQPAQPVTPQPSNQPAQPPMEEPNPPADPAPAENE